MNPVLNIIGNMMGMGGMGGNMNAGATQGTTQGGNPLAGIMSLYSSLSSSSDPMKAIQSMAQFNPQVKQAVDVINQNGGDMKSTFYKLAQEKGVDPDQVMSMVQNMKL